MMMLSTAADVVEALGNTAAVARLTGKTMKAVSNWKKRNRIAPDAYAVMDSELRIKGMAASPAIWSQVQGKRRAS